MRRKGTSVTVLMYEGEVRASYSVVGHGSKLAWIGMILVDEAYRGGGWGWMPQVLANRFIRSRASRSVAQLFDGGLFLKAPRSLCSLCSRECMKEFSCLIPAG